MGVPAPLSPAVLMAHRGWPSRYPENSLAGVRAALEAGARMVEFDIQLSADGVPVVIHDDDLARTAGREAGVLDLPAAELAGVDVGEAARFGDRHRGTPLPTLAEMLALIDEYPEATAFVELKRASMRRFGAGAVIDAVMPLVGRHARRVPISLDADLAERARTAGAADIGWVVPSLDDASMGAARALAPGYLFCPADGVPATGRPFPAGPWRRVVYDVNEPGTARDLLDRGVDIIETDRIGEMLGRDDG